MATTTDTRVLTVERLETRFDSPLRISGYVFEAMPSVAVTIADGHESGRGEAAASLKRLKRLKPSRIRSARTRSPKRNARLTRISSDA